MSVEQLHPSPSCPRAIVKPAKTLLGVLPEAANQARNHAHDVPQQRVVSWVMNEKCKKRSI